MFHLDYETFSPEDLPAVQAYRYAAHPDAEILMLAVAENDQEPKIWVPDHHNPLGEIDTAPGRRLLEKLSKSDDPIFAHNAEFEIAITKYCWASALPFPAPDKSRWRCTAAMARRAAMPGKLATLAKALGLPEQKDKRGTALIKLFCSLHPKTGRRTLPIDSFSAFLEFVEYCLQDVRTEQAVTEELSAFQLEGESLRTYQLHVGINDRGFPVNVPALENAQIVIDEVMEEMGGKFFEMTGLRTTQTQKLTPWFRERGYPGKNLQSLTVEKWVANTKWVNDRESRRAHEALKLRQQLAFAAVKKVTSMLKCQVDGRVRGTLLYHGAGPGRSSGKGTQPQNFKRPTIKDTAAAYDLICHTDPYQLRENLDLLWGNPLEAISSSVRHFIQRPKGNILDADYAGIEARIVCWLADQMDALRDFRRYDEGKGPNAYEIMAAAIFEMAIDQITEHSIERFVGKQTVLGCGFGMGWSKFVETCAKFGITITDEMAQHAVTMFRQVRHKVVKLWGYCDSAARKAIRNPNKWFWAGSKIKFAVTTAGALDYLVMKLPSGRRIVYPDPRIESVNRFGKEKATITFYGKLPKQSIWGRCSTYGGKLVENATQGTAADIMFHGAANAEAKGFPILTLVHDQALADETGRIEEYVAALCDLPAWADGLPIAAEGKVVPYYLK